MVKVKDWSFPLDDRWNIQDWTDTSGGIGLLEGSIHTKYGIVGVTAIRLEWRKDRPATILSIVFDGINYRRSISKLYSKRYMITLAKRFAKEIHNQLKE